MNENFLRATGYQDLGMLKEAREEFLKVRSDDATYACARTELMMLSSQLDVAAMKAEAEGGLNLIRSRPEIVHSALINNTALCLHYAGRTHEAHDLINEFADILEWTPGDFYGLACYAAGIGDSEEAASALLEGMASGLSPEYSHMFMDPDLEPLFLHAAEGEMTIETAVRMANPRLVAALAALENTDELFDGMLLREMPPKFQRHSRIHLTEGMYRIDLNAPVALQRRLRGWLKGVRDRVTELVRRGITRARKLVLDAQFDFAVAAAKRGDFFAARYHSMFGFSARPESFDRFDAALSPLGMGYLFNDIRRAWGEDPVFQELIRSTTPVESLSPIEHIENLEDCGRLAKETTLWILLRAVVARAIDRPPDIKLWNIEVIRRWPDDPAAFHNLLSIYEGEGAWDRAAILLAHVPPSFHHLRHAKSHSERVRLQKLCGFPKSRNFYGQPDLGQLVIFPMVSAIHSMQRAGKPADPIPSHSQGQEK